MTIGTIMAAVAVSASPFDADGSRSYPTLPPQDAEIEMRGRVESESHGFGCPCYGCRQVSDQADANRRRREDEAETARAEWLRVDYDEERRRREASGKDEPMPSYPEYERRRGYETPEWVIQYEAQKRRNGVFGDRSACGGRGFGDDGEDAPVRLHR